MRNPVHPGAILREDVLVELGLSVSEAAERLGVARSWLAMQSVRDLAEERAGGTPKVRRLDTVSYSP
ncbi:MAG: addiction module antidote protein HigA family [Actinomycetota bacterium]